MIFLIFRIREWRIIRIFVGNYLFYYDSVFDGINRYIEINMVILSFYF